MNNALLIETALETTIRKGTYYFFHIPKKQEKFFIIF
jgi:hypothetical protein